MIFELPDKYIQANDFLFKLAQEKACKVEIKEYKPKRTNLQNRYYWAILNFISSETGNETEYLHEYFKNKYLPGWYQLVFNEAIIINTTKSLNTKEFADYIEKISIFVSHFGVMIPRPEDKNFDQFLKHYENFTCR